MALVPKERNKMANLIFIQLENNYKNFTKNGGSVNIDHRHGTIAIEFGNNNSSYFPDSEEIFLQGEDFNILDECPEKLSEGAWLVYNYL